MGFDMKSLPILRCGGVGPLGYRQLLQGDNPAANQDLEQHPRIHSSWNRGGSWGFPKISYSVRMSGCSFRRVYRKRRDANEWASVKHATKKVQRGKHFVQTKFIENIICRKLTKYLFVLLSDNKWMFLAYRNEYRKVVELNFRGLMLQISA